MWFLWSKRGGFIFLRDMSRYSKMDQQNLHFLMIAAVIWAIYQAKIIEKNGTFESTLSRPVMNDVLLHIMRRWHAQRWRLWRLVYNNNAHCTCVGSRLDCIHATIGPCWSFVLTRMCLLCSHWPKQIALLSRVQWGRLKWCEKNI